jgi:phosphoribosylformylglycinamidine synthase
VATLASADGAVSSLHDVSGGGLALALAEGAVRGGVGCTVHGVAGPGELFSESPSRVVVGTERPDDILARAGDAGVPARLLGTAGGDRVVVEGLLDVTVDGAVEAWRAALPGALGEPVTA